MRIRKTILTAAALALCLLPAAALADTYEISQKLREDMPGFRFSFTYDLGDYSAQDLALRAESGADDFRYVHAITVFREDDRSLVQQLTLNPPAETFFDDDPKLGKVLDGIALEDMNFDGYLDLRVMQYASGSSGIPYYCYLWDPSSGQFAYSEPLSAIISPTFDPVNHLVHSTEYVNAEWTAITDYTDTSSAYVDTTYAYSGAALTPIGRITTGYDYASGMSITTVEQLVDGQLTVTEARRERFLEDTPPPEVTEEPYRFSTQTPAPR